MFPEPFGLKRQVRLFIARRKSRLIAVRTPLGSGAWAEQKRQQESIPFLFPPRRRKGWVEVGRSGDVCTASAIFFTGIVTQVKDFAGTALDCGSQQQ